MAWEPGYSLSCLGSVGSSTGNSLEHNKENLIQTVCEQHS